MENFRQAAIIGLGLMGGSTAKNLKTHTSITVYGHDRKEKTIADAIDQGAIDGRLTKAHLASCDLVVVALYPKDAVDFIIDHLNFIQKGAVVIDLCGIKRFLHDQLWQPCQQRGIHYLGAHPMAGRETSGFAHSMESLYDEASMILTPDPDLPKVVLDRVRNLCRQMGFRQIVETTPEHHDDIIAYTSQLAHVLSSAYIQNPAAGQFNGFTGGSFQDLTRVSRLNETMWGELFLRNKDMLTKHLGYLIGKLESYKQSLEQEDTATLFQLMERGTTIKNRLLQEEKGELLEE